MTLQIEFDYKAKKLITDKSALNMKNLYEGYNNLTNIVVYQGTNDNLIDPLSKKTIAESIERVEFNLIDEKDIDGIAVKSNTHGLNADFLQLFELAYPKVCQPIKKELCYAGSFEIKLSDTIIYADFSKGLPIFTLDVIESQVLYQFL